MELNRLTEQYGHIIEKHCTVRGRPITQMAIDMQYHADRLLAFETKKAEVEQVKKNAQARIWEARHNVIAADAAAIADDDRMIDASNKLLKFIAEAQVKDQTNFTKLASGLKNAERAYDVIIYSLARKEPGKDESSIEGMRPWFEWSQHQQRQQKKLREWQAKYYGSVSAEPIPV